MQLFIPIIMFFGTCLILRSIINNRGKNKMDDFRHALAQEQQANFARAKDLPQDFMRVPDISFLSATTFRHHLDTLAQEQQTLLDRLEQNILQKYNKPMAKLPGGMTNLEIKQTYGLVNLDKISALEGHFYEYLHALNFYAERLLDFNLHLNAEQVLRHAVYDMSSDILKSYTLLHGLYQAHDPAKLTALISDIQKADSIIKDEAFRAKITQTFQSN